MSIYITYIWLAYNIAVTGRQCPCITFKLACSATGQWPLSCCCCLYCCSGKTGKLEHFTYFINNVYKYIHTYIYKFICISTVLTRTKINTQSQTHFFLFHIYIFLWIFFFLNILNVIIFYYKLFRKHDIFFTYN